MKRFLTSLVIFAAVLMTVLIGSVFVLPDNHLCNSMLGVQHEKLNRLARLEGPRIIFVGGSNVGHGFDSGVVEKAFGRPVMNMGLHAGLGLIYHMRSIQDLVHKGDLVVVVPEYNMFADSCWGDTELLGMVSAIIPEHRKLLTWKQHRRLLMKVPSYGARKLLRLPSLFVEKNPVSCYNSCGDNQDWKRMTSRLPFPSSKGGKGTSAFTGEVISDINEFVGSCKSKGADVFFMPPVYERSSYLQSEEFIETIEHALEMNKTPFIVSPRRYALPDEWFADTEYHLNNKGVSPRMAQIVEDLQAVIKPKDGGVE